MRQHILAAAAAALLFQMPAAAEAADLPVTAQEINLTASAYTAVISGLQGRINGGKATAEDLDPAALRSAYAAAFARLAGGGATAPADAATAEIRAAMDRAFAAVIEHFRADILRGGEDAFVPAFFRAQLFERFNAAMAGRYRAVATNRKAELINADSAVDRLIDDAAIVAHITRLMETGAQQPETRAFGQRVVGYWPMTIGEACASCHQRSGLRQQVGQYGGATVVIVGR